MKENKEEKQISKTKKLQTPGLKPAEISWELFNYLDKLPYDTKSFPEKDLYDDLRSKHRPIIYRDTARILELLVLLRKPLKILEIGTHSGFSAICLGKYLDPKGVIHTIEYRIDHIAEAMENIDKYGKKEQIVIFQGIALDVLNDLLDSDSYDLIFIDADKCSYSKYLKYAKTHLNDNGLILVDNLLWKCAVFSEDEELKNKLSTKTIASFNDEFIKMNDFHTQILPVGDGLGIAIKMK